jgi:hypothetical protein
VPRSAVTVWTTFAVHSQSPSFRFSHPCIETRPALTAWSTKSSESFTLGVPCDLARARIPAFDDALGIQHHDRVVADLIDQRLKGNLHAP